MRGERCRRTLRTLSPLPGVMGRAVRCHPGSDDLVSRFNRSERRLYAILPPILPALTLQPSPASHRRPDRENGPQRVWAGGLCPRGKKMSRAGAWTPFSQIRILHGPLSAWSISWGCDSSGTPFIGTLRGRSKGHGEVRDCQDVLFPFPQGYTHPDPSYMARKSRLDFRVHWCPHENVV